MFENYKRGTVVITEDKEIELSIEGQGPLHLNQSQFRTMAIATLEMLSGHAATCWQDYLPGHGYIRVTHQRQLCKRQCTRRGMQSTILDGEDSIKRNSLLNRIAVKSPVNLNALVSQGVESVAKFYHRG